MAFTKMPRKFSKIIQMSEEISRVLPLRSSYSCDIVMMIFSKYYSLFSSAHPSYHMLSRALRRSRKQVKAREWSDTMNGMLKNWSIRSLSSLLPVREHVKWGVRYIFEQPWWYTCTTSFVSALEYSGAKVCWSVEAWKGGNHGAVYIARATVFASCHHPAHFTRKSANIEARVLLSFQRSIATIRPSPTCQNMK